MGVLVRFLVGAVIVAVSLATMIYLLDRNDGPINSPVSEFPQTEVAQKETRSAPPSSPSGGLPENAGLRINDEGLAIITESEGLSLTAYQLNGQWLIGYGHSATAKPGMTISEAQAKDLLRQDLQVTEDGLKKVLTVPVNRNEFSAMVSLAYNLGIGGFKKTVVYEQINKGDRRGAADGFLVHDRVRINGVLTSVEHLTQRREKERTLFLKPA